MQNFRKSYTKTEEEALYQEAKSFGERPIQIEVDLSTLLAIIGNLQLALRHPINKGPSSKVIRSFISQIRKKFSEYPEIQKLIDRGFNQSYDYTQR